MCAARWLHFFVIPGSESGLVTFPFLAGMTRVAGTVSRQKEKDICTQYLDVTVLPPELQDLVFPLIYEQLLKPNITKAELLRFLFLTPELKDFRNLTNAQLAAFLRCSRTNVCKVLQALAATPTPAVEVERGRPSVLSREAEEAIRTWLRQRMDAMEWPTLATFKEQVFRCLEVEAPNFVPQNQFYYDLLERLSTGELTVRAASALEPARYDVTSDVIRQHFDTLDRLRIQDFDPRLVINIDETGFGQSKSGRSKPQKVIVPVSFQGSPIYKEQEEKRYVSCIAATTLSGTLLTPALISNRQQEAGDAEKCSFFGKCARYHSTTAFVSRDIFMRYMRTVVLPYIQSVRQELSEVRPALILFDGHKGHFSDLLAAACAENQIHLVVLPPHSSHLVQPLDRFIFRRMKREYGMMSPIQSLTKISSTLERVWSAYQAANVMWIIWRSWEAAGIKPNIEKGICVSCTLDLEGILQDRTLQHSFTPQERSRGTPVETGAQGFLNEDEFMLLEAGLCPYCCAPLSDANRQSRGSGQQHVDRDLHHSEGQ